MNVTPQISNSNSVLLNLRPSVTRILSFVNDPNPSLPAGIVNRIPEIQTREMESVVMVENGQIAVMGGLIQDGTSDTQDSIPGLSSVPFFSNRNKTNTKTELVVFIRPTVVKDPSLEGDFRNFQRYLPNET